jgi:hypothetical protein
MPDFLVPDFKLENTFSWQNRPIKFVIKCCYMFYAMKDSGKRR